jgi:hypothetical protein
MRFDSPRGLLWHIEQLLEKSFGPDFAASKFSARAKLHPSATTKLRKHNSKPAIRTLISQLT